MKWEQLGGIDVNPSVLAWNNLFIHGNINLETSISLVFNQFGDGYAGKIYFCFDDLTFQNGYILALYSDDSPQLIKMTSGTPTVIASGSIPLEGGQPTNIGIQLNLDGGMIYCEVSDDSLSPTNSIIYETPNEYYSNQKFAIGLEGTGIGSDAAWLNEIDIANNSYFLLDTFTSPGTPGDTLTDYISDDGHTRTPIAGRIVYDGDGIGAKWADDGFSTSPAIFSYGHIASSVNLVFRLKDLSTGIDLYFNFDDDTLQNGWFLHVTDSDITVYRRDSGSDTSIYNSAWGASVNEARVALNTIGGNISIEALGFVGDVLDGNSISLSGSMGGMYDSQDTLAIGLASGGSDDQIFYVKVY